LLINTVPCLHPSWRVLTWLKLRFTLRKN